MKFVYYKSNSDNSYDDIFFRSIIRPDTWKSLGKLLDFIDRWPAIAAYDEITIWKNLPQHPNGGSRHLYSGLELPDSIANHTTLDETHAKHVGEPPHIFGQGAPIGDG